MKKTIVSLLLASASYAAFADDSTESAPAVVNSNSTYINRYAYLQNPWISVTSGGGTQNISESQLATQNVAEKWFADGTWNFWGGTTAQYAGSKPNSFSSFAYGGSFFAQTGQVAGFSFGGAMSLVNPYFATDMNGSNPNKQAYFMPSVKQDVPTEAFVEYQYNNLLQVDAGYIGITNSPWLSSNYYNNMLAPAFTYRGALLNIAPGGGWLITALAFDRAQGISETGFTNLTNYNTGYDYSGGNIANNTVTGNSQYTIAVGGNYTAWNNQYNLRLWDYEFENYGQLLYADSSLKFKPTDNLALNIAAQGGSDNSNPNYSNGNGTNALTDNGYGQIQSNFAGIQGGLSYKIFSLNVGYNNVWGNQTAYGSGAIVSPYTYGMATDPLYTTPYMAGLVDMGTAGSAFKVSPSLNFLDGNLSIAPAWTTFSTAAPQFNGTNEYDLTATYSMPQVKGLTFFAVYAYQQVPQANQSGDNYVTQVFVSYLY